MSDISKVSHIPEINNKIQDYLWGNKESWKTKNTTCILPTFKEPKDTILLNMIPNNKKIKYVCMEYEWVDRLPCLSPIDTNYNQRSNTSTIDDVIDDTDDLNIYEILSYIFFFYSM